MKKRTWHNFRTGKQETEEPTDYRDTIPQDEASQKLYGSLLEDMKPDEAALLILSLNFITQEMAEEIVSLAIQSKARNN